MLDFVSLLHMYATIVIYNIVLKQLFYVRILIIFVLNMMTFKLQIIFFILQFKNCKIKKIKYGLNSACNKNNKSYVSKWYCVLDILY